MATNNGTGIDRDTANLVRVRQALNEMLNEILNAVLDVKVTNSVNINNFDELKLMDLKTSNKLVRAINDAVQKQGAMVADAIRGIPKPPMPPSEISVTNFPKAPRDISINNLGTLITRVEELTRMMKGKDFSPVITPPAVNVPETAVNVDLSSLLDALEPLAQLSSKPTSPIAVRLSDGKKFVKALQAVASAAKKQATVFSASSGITQDEMRTELGPPATFTSGKLALTSATVAVQVNSAATNITWIDVSAVGQPIAVGDSTCVVDLATPANSIGNVLYPGSNPHRMNIKTLSDLYAAGPTGSTIAYNYFER